MRPPDRTALTTGANSGIGLATALELARRGFDSVGSVRSPEKASLVEAAAERRGVRVRTVLLDVTDSAACARVVDEVRPDAIVNNAGVSAGGAIEDVTDADARAALETMVVAPMRLARLALPHMRERRWGRIVNVSSIFGTLTTPLTGWYQGAKHALEALSDALRIEVAPAGVKVVLVAPGGFRTGIWLDAQAELAKYAGSRYARNYRRVLANIRFTEPIMGAPDRVARAIGRAVTSPRPAARYLVGLDARALSAVDRLAPVRLADLVKRTLTGL